MILSWPTACLHPEVDSTVRCFVTGPVVVPLPAGSVTILGGYNLVRVTISQDTRLMLGAVDTLQIRLGTIIDSALTGTRNTNPSCGCSG